VTLNLLAGEQIVQGSHGWLRADDHEDFVFRLDVAEADPGLSIYIETSHSLDESTFQVINTGNTTLSTGATKINSRAGYSFVAVATYTRWRVAATSNASTTFRIVVSAYSVRTTGAAS
jgi:hypothetical protein